VPMMVIFMIYIGELGNGKIEPGRAARRTRLFFHRLENNCHT
jgi:hypothetical protein